MACAEDAIVVGDKVSVLFFVGVFLCFVRVVVNDSARCGLTSRYDLSKASLRRSSL